jgi:hypothetical protein
MLVGRDQVLDSETLGVEAVEVPTRPSTPPPISENRTMIDPGALGTLLIGLDDVRRDNASTDRPTPTVRPHRDRSLTRSVAASLRRLADAIEPASRQGDLGLEG